MKSEMPQIAGKAVPVRGDDIDTDRIIPARFMKTVTFEGLGKYAFYDARFDEMGRAKKHPFNDPKHKGAVFLIVNRNFGSGSSREHAPQALKRFGIKAIIGESFAEIFSGNCQLLGMPCVTAGAEDIRILQDFAEKEDPEAILNLNLADKKLNYNDTSIAVEIPEERRKTLVEGSWNTLGLLVSALDKTRKKVAELPYIKNFK
ncbi:MAG TPA: 3-isopropylmalate dehydratase small subunit [archaeon]|nr:3-isopropylmalate dehydratase small subunit [archaeon]